MKRITPCIVARITLAAALLTLAATAFALPPPRPGLVDPLTQRFRTTGAKVPIFPKEIRTYRRATPLSGRLPLAVRSTAKAAGLPRAIGSATDNQVAPLVLLIDFSTRPASASPSISDNAVFANLFFGTGTSDLSVANYWREVSYGKFVLARPRDKAPADLSRPDVAGWLRADSFSAITPADIAGVQAANVRQLLSDAIGYLVGQGFDFRPYVRASDRTFQSVVLVHPGYGQEDAGAPGDPYSHTAGLSVPIPVTISGTTYNIVDYTIVPGLQAPSSGVTNPAVDPRIGIGVIVHEMGHLFGLPDLYPTASGLGVADNVFSGAGVFDLMAYGMWGDSQLLTPSVPAHLSVWSKSFLGWLTPSLVNASATRTLRPVELFPEADKIYSNTSADLTQYFLVENREQLSSLGSWLFDKFPMNGLLVWQVDEAVINAHLATNDVNSNSTFRGLYVKEADGILHMGTAIPGTGTRADRAVYFGQQADFFLGAGQLFDRTNPSAAVNSSPIVDSSFTSHPFDFGQQVSMVRFSQLASNAMSYVVGIVGGGSSVPSWKTFNRTSTEPPRYPVGMRSDNILSIAFDSGNNAWMGSGDQGIFRFLGTTFEILTTSRGLPSPGPGAPAGATVGAIQAMAFESSTGSMWIGTDQGIHKMRDSGSGFRVQSSFTEGSLAPDKLLAGENSIAAIVIRGGFTFGSAAINLKYAATPLGLLRIDDRNTDNPADDNPIDSNPRLVLTVAGVVPCTAVALDDNGTPNLAADDVLWVGFANGDLYRSLLPTEAGGPTDADPLISTHFKKMATLSGSPRITSLAVDKKSRLWIGTDSRGLQLFDLGETLSPAQPNVRDPFNFKEATPPRPEEEAYLNFNLVADNNGVHGSNHVTGIGFESSPQAEVIAWISHKSDSNPGGVSRFDANLADDNTTVNRDERLRVFSPIPPNDVATAFGRSTAVSAAVGDSAGNVWFATMDPQRNGVVRFGNAGIISLDSSNYVNTSAIARVTLQDDGLNVDPGVADIAIVRVKKKLAPDSDAFPLVLTETGPDTGIFQGEFGFTLGTTDVGVSPPLLQVASGDEIEVKYVDFDPPGVRSATATWKKVFPFEDTWIIDHFSCFIATAAYGSSMAPEVDTFRKFRDRYLAPSGAGRLLVDLYYFASPPLADVIANSAILRAGARCVLTPALMVSKFAVTSSAAEKEGVLLIIVLVLAGWMRSGKTARILLDQKGRHVDTTCCVFWRKRGAGNEVSRGKGGWEKEG